MKTTAKLTWLVLLGLFILFYSLTAAAGPDGDVRKARIKLVTYNLYVGADIFRVFDPPACGVPQAVNDIYNTIRQTNFPERAEAIADQIMQQEPHVIGLQEVSLLRTQFPGNSLAPDGSGIELLGDSENGPLFTFKQDAAEVEFDYLQILQNALMARGLYYHVVENASTINADTEFPAIEFDAACNPLSVPVDVRLTDRDVVLVRADLPVVSAMKNNFAVNTPVELPTLLPTPAGFIPAVYVAEFTRGWGAVNVTVKDQNFSVLNTHLEVGDRALPPDEGLNLVQFAQALEIGEVQDILPRPTFVIGDFNSSPFSGVTDPRPAYAVLSGSFGLVDAWSDQSKPAKTAGYTCCQSETVDNLASSLDERIDIVFANLGDLVPEKIKLDTLGDQPGDKSASALWPSDHAGVAAQFKFER